MFPLQRTQQTSFFFLTTLLLMSLFFAACESSRTVSKQAAPHPLATATATKSSLPTISADSDWKIVFQTEKDATHLATGKSQMLLFNQIPSSSSFTVYGTCTGNGSANFTTNSTSTDGSSASNSISIATRTPSGCSVSFDSNNTGNGGSESVTKGELEGIRSTSDTIAHITINLTITGPIKWEIVVEEPI